MISRGSAPGSDVGLRQHHLPGGDIHRVLATGDVVGLAACAVRVAFERIAGFPSYRALGALLWPRMLLADWSPAPADVGHAVDEAVTTMLARYGHSANDSQHF